MAKKEKRCREMELENRQEQTDPARRQSEAETRGIPGFNSCSAGDWRWALGLYWRLIGVQIRSQMQYRVSFLLDLLSTFCFTATYFLTVTFILARFDHIGGWRLGEIALLYGSVEIAYGITDMVAAGFDPDRFSRYMRLGTFDQILLRPVSPTLQVIGSQFVLKRWGRIVFGGAVLGAGLHLTGIEWTAGKALLLPVSIVSLSAFFAGLFIIGATITFWTVQSIEAINILTAGGCEMMSYPMHIYGEPLRRFFTYILPAVFLNYAPTCYLLDRPDTIGLPSFAPFLSPVVGLSILLSGMRFWRYGIDHYQSAGT